MLVSRRRFDTGHGIGLQLNHEDYLPLKLATTQIVRFKVDDSHYTRYESRFALRVMHHTLMQSPGTLDLNELLNF